MKIIQIISTPVIETFHEIPGMIHTTNETIYGLSDEGKMYLWSERQMKLRVPEKYTDDEDGVEKEKTTETAKGWVLQEDEIGDKVKYSNARQH